MVCIYCGSKLSVTNSRAQKKSNQVWRRRLCSGCQATLTSVESIDLGKAIGVSDKPGRLEPFSRDKLFISIYESCKHRKSALKDATALTDTAITRLLPQIENATLRRQQIIDTTQQILINFDKPASVHYTAYHQV